MQIIKTSRQSYNMLCSRVVINETLNLKNIFIFGKYYGVINKQSLRTTYITFIKNLYEKG